MGITEIVFTAGFMFGTAFGFILCAVLGPDELPVPCEEGKTDAEEG